MKPYSLSAFAAAVLLFTLSGCSMGTFGTSSEDPADPSASEQSDETKTVTAEYSDHYSNVRMELPDGWTYEIKPLSGPEDDPGYLRGGIAFGPEDQPDIEMGLYFYTRPYGICGTGVTREDLTFSSGREATLYWEELDDASYAYVFYKDVPGEYLFEAHYIPTEFWRSERETILAVLDTAVVGEGTLTASEALAAAQEKYPDKRADGNQRFDYLSGQWTICFHNAPSPEPFIVTVHPDGTVVP